MSSPAVQQAVPLTVRASCFSVYFQRASIFLRLERGLRKPATNNATNELQKLIAHSAPFLLKYLDPFLRLCLFLSLGNPFLCQSFHIFVPAQYFHDAEVQILFKTQCWLSDKM